MSYAAGSFELDDKRRMSGGGRRALRFVALSAALALGTIAIPNGHAAGDKPKLRPPTFLWKTYPLVQRPRVSAARRTVSQTRVASGPSSPQSPTFDDMLLMTALLATLLAAGTVLLLRRPTTARAGASAGGRGEARTPRRPARRPQPRRAPATNEPAPPTDAVERVLDNLLEALEPNPRAGAQQERIPEVELRELIVRKYAAPAAARASIEREIDAALERIAARRAAEAAARTARRTSLARSEIRLWRGLVKSQLYAAVSGSEEAFAVSGPFRLRDADVPSAQAQHALGELLADLEHAGWTVVAHGSTWYEHTLELAPSDPADARRADDEVLPRIIYRRVPPENEPEDGGS